jgi:serine protease Do
VEGADELEVKLADGRSFKAELAGADPATELAVIQLQGDLGDLPTAELGNSDKLYVGEWVIAIGNPLGLSHSVSAGIVSAKGRGLGGRIARYEDLIQTDAAINPGNSGGPLVNLRGEVIGVNTAIVSRTGGYMGIGLAIPINMAKGILDDLKAGREVRRGFLGIIGADLTPELAGQFGYESTEGALVNEVLEESPADEANLKAGDIITTWKGQEVNDFAHLRRMVAATEPGAEVKVKIWREGKERTLTIEVARLQTQRQARAETWLGVTVESVTDETRERFGRDRLQGVVITEVEPDSPAGQALEDGDVILSVNRQPVRNVEEFQRMMARTEKEKGALLHVLDRRTGHARFLYVRGR